MMTATECPSSEQLKLYAVGRLPEVESEQLFEHLSQCDECQSQLETVDDGEDSLLGELRSAEESDPDPFAAEPDCRLAVAKALGSLVQLESNAAELPREIGDYALIRAIGRGGMGEVYLARHIRLGREVAIKVISGKRSVDNRSRERFEAEMRAVGRLSHPNIVSALDARDVDGVAVLVTEYVDGFDLGEIVSRVGPLSVGDACEIVRKVAAALQYTSDQGFVHRDVKPSNIMVSRGGEVKLLDLGLARLSATEERSVDLTATGQAIGTADYVAPEQVMDGKSVDSRADIYSLGCTLFKLLTGHAPFADDDRASAYAKMNAHVSAAPPSLGDQGQWPTRLVKLVDSMLAKHVERRPQQPKDVASAVSGFSEGHDLVALVKQATESEPKTTTMMRSTSPKSEAWFRRRIPVTVAIATGFFGLVFGLMFGLFIKITYPDGTTVEVPIGDGKMELVTKDGESSKKARTVQQTEVLALQSLGVEEAVAILERFLNDELGDESPVIDGDPRGTNVLIRGTPEQIATAKKLLRELDHSTSQQTKEARPAVVDALAMFDGIWRLSGVTTTGRSLEVLAGDEVVLAIKDGRAMVAAYRDEKAELIASGEVTQKEQRFQVDLRKPGGDAFGEIMISSHGSLGARGLSLSFLSNGKIPVPATTQEYQRIAEFPANWNAMNAFIGTLDSSVARRFAACMKLIQSRWKFAATKSSAVGIDEIFQTAEAPILEFDGVWQLTETTQVDGDKHVLSGDQVVVAIEQGKVCVAAIRDRSAELVARGRIIQEGARQNFSALMKTNDEAKTVKLSLGRGRDGDLFVIHLVQLPDDNLRRPVSQQFRRIGDFPAGDAAFAELVRSLPDASWLRSCLATIQRYRAGIAKRFEGVWEMIGSSSTAKRFVVCDAQKWYCFDVQGEQPVSFSSGSYRVDLASDKARISLTQDGQPMQDAELHNETLHLGSQGLSSMYRRLDGSPGTGLSGLGGETTYAFAVRVLAKLRSEGLDHTRRLALSVDSKNDLKAIGIAMHNYAAAHDNQFPAGALHRRDASGETYIAYPMSWRVAILPYIGFPQLYDQYRQDEPWDGPNNRKLLGQMPPFFLSPFAGDELPFGHTNYLGFATEGSLLEGKVPVSPDSCTDALSQTLMVTDAKKSVPWTKPEDLDSIRAEDLREPMLVLMADGSVRSLVGAKQNLTWIEKMVTHSGGEAITITTY